VRAAHIRCFLSRPFGHRWKFFSEHGDEHLRCIDCGKRAKTGTYRGPAASAGPTHDDGAYGGGDSG
jgi:hypothetical protein